MAGGLKSKKFAILLFTAIFVVTMACFATTSTGGGASGTWRYKITVNVDTPEGIKSGSAVREVSAHSDRPYNLAKATTKGEAVVVDLGERGTLFAIMDYDGAYQVVFKAFPNAAGGLTPDGIRYYSALKNAKAELIPGEIPEFARLVTFTDLKNPKTVKGVDYRHLDKTFGQGVKIKSVTIEMTNDAVTWGIEKWLTWLPELKMSYLSGQHINGPELYQQLDGGAFKRGG